MAPRTKGSILPETILQAATRLFIEQGFDGTSMYDIADALGVTRTAVYYYYKNKEAILIALTDNVTSVAAHIAEAAERYRRGVLASFAAVIERGVKQGKFRP